MLDATNSPYNVRVTTSSWTRDIILWSQVKDCMKWVCVWWQYFLKPVPTPKQDNEKRILSYKSTLIVYGKPKEFQAEASRMTRTVHPQLHCMSIPPGQESCLESCDTKSKVLLCIFVKRLNKEINGRETLRK